MQPFTHTLGVAILALASVGLRAEDFRPLMAVTQATWPGMHHIGVICDYPNSQEEVQALARAAGPGASITVADTRRTEFADRAATLLRNRKMEFVVLLPHDRLFRDGSYGATLAADSLGRHGVPILGTTPVALKQGAAFSVGEGTNGELLVTSRLIGTVDVILPARQFYREKVGQWLQAPATSTSAAIAVVSMP